ncbi:transposase [Chitinophaga pinensis]|uniref:transposase n=1 Tax=Chitinophaga pinensis TaxID=79329 RepID=UPI00019E344F
MGLSINLFEFSLKIFKIIYTTNLIENVNRGIRKYTEARSILPGEQAVEKWSISV